MEKDWYLTVRIIILNNRCGFVEKCKKHKICFCWNVDNWTWVRWVITRYWEGYTIESEISTRTCEIGNWKKENWGRRKSAAWYGSVFWCARWKVFSSFWFQAALDKLRQERKWRNIQKRARNYQKPDRRQSNRRRIVSHSESHSHARQKAAKERKQNLERQRQAKRQVWLCRSNSRHHNHVDANNFCENSPWVWSSAPQGNRFPLKCYKSQSLAQGECLDLRNGT